MLKRVTLSMLVMLVTVGFLAVIARGQDGERQAIRTVIESFSAALDRSDLPRLLVHIAEDAVIDSKVAGGKVGKSKYADAMARAFEAREIVGFETHDIKITMVDATRATVLATIYPTTKFQRYIYNHEWSLEKRDGRWLVVATAYRTKPPEPVTPHVIARRAA